MEFIKSFREQLKYPENLDFESLALKAFYFQASHNSIYKAYLKNLNIAPETITNLFDIPFLPIDFFKSHEIKSSKLDTKTKFLSSGTTLKQRSAHHLDDLSFYLNHSKQIFESSYGSLDEFTIIAVLPSYLEQGDSSLIAMVDFFINKSSSQVSGYYLENPSELQIAVKKSESLGKKTLIIGVTYALLNLADQKVDLSGCIVMETGGMKGRGRELVRKELHSILKQGLNVERIHSEYGMTELLSQSYSKNDGIFKENFWMKILLRDINDPFSNVRVGKTGGINVIDLGNIFSCCFIETKDLGRKTENGDFEVLGRFDNSDLRGCNLLLV